TCSTRRRSRGCSFAGDGDDHLHRHLATDPPPGVIMVAVLTEKTHVLAIFALVAGATSAVADDKLDGRPILDKVVDGDRFGMITSKLVGRAVLHDKKNNERVLEFRMDRLGYKTGLSKTLTRFSKPADMAGVGFLQTMRDDADDDRFLYLPDLKK